MSQNSPKKRKRRSSKGLAVETTAKQKPPHKSQQRRSSKTLLMEAKAAKVNSLESLLDLCKITNWHYLMVGDGSCTGKWKYEAGFACTIINRQNPADFYSRHGAFDRGTNIVAEMMAYVLPLMEIANTQKNSVRRVHIMTDCEYLPKAAANVAWQQKANRELWTMLRSFKPRGLLLHWHWIPRDTIDMNRFCHDLANSARVSMKGLAEANLKKHEFTTVNTNGTLDDEETDAE